MLKIIGVGMAFILMAVVLTLLSVIPVWLIWNAIIPTITKNALTEITFLQAFGITFLSNILFKKSSDSSSS